MARPATAVRPPRKYSRNSRDEEKKRKRKQTLAAREIKHYQATTFLLLRRASFQRFVREIVMDLFPQSSLRFQETALMALQESAEAYLVNLFGNTGFVAANAKRKTIMARDMQLVCHIRDSSL